MQSSAPLMWAKVTVGFHTLLSEHTWKECENRPTWLPAPRASPPSLSRGLCLWTGMVPLPQWRDYWPLGKGGGSQHMCCCGAPISLLLRFPGSQGSKVHRPEEPPGHSEHGHPPWNLPEALAPCPTSSLTHSPTHTHKHTTILKSLPPSATKDRYIHALYKYSEFERNCKINSLKDLPVQEMRIMYMNDNIY